jgi:exoribonuclease-2
MFSVVYGVLLRPLPFPQPNRLVFVQEASLRHEGTSPTAPATFRDWRDQQHVFSSMAAAELWGASLTGSGQPEEIPGLRVSAALLSVLRAQPALGRGFAEGEDRVALAVEMAVKDDGTLAASDLYRAVVRNRAKLAYNAVAAWLEGTGAIPDRVAAVPSMEAQLRLQDQVAQRLREVRHHHGALSLETVQARPVFDGEVLTDLEVEETNRAKALIEDFMIAANGVTARYLEARGYPSLRRVLRSPERWERIVALAAGLGERLPAEPDAAALEAFLTKRRDADPLRFPDLSLAVVKLMGRGEYVVEFPGQTVPGHFGLAVQAYTHSTAPNRRFPDVIAQRLLKAALARRPAPYPSAELEELAQHCTEAEDRANKVERQVGKSAAALLLEPRIGDRFDAIVTGASDKGTWVRILRPPVEGKLVHGADGLDVGDRVRVELIGTDVEQGHIDFVKANGGSQTTGRMGSEKAGS